jgi:capsular exopolysaccharide synthesis family protein
MENIMTRLFAGLSRAAIQPSQPDRVPPDILPSGMDLPGAAEPAKVLGDVMRDAIGIRGTGEPREVLETDKTRSVMVQPPATSRLAAWNEPNSLGAERFRALAVRLDAIRRQHELKSLQVTSSVINEGKTFVAANLAVTLAKYSGSNTLLIEGDLHRPTVAAMFGLKGMKGLSDWWSGPEQDIARFLVRFTGTRLWFLPAGTACERPSEILRSAQLAEAFAQLAGRFDWIVVDSTPMLPVIDANLWSRLVDGTLLVVREGVAPLKAFKKGLQSLDHPKLIGVVVNAASEFDQIDYHGQYYGARKYGDKRSEKLR